jgi:hypothetical protein
MRDYDPTTGRYIQGEPLGLVDGPSVFAYASQSPFRYIDPMGLNNNSSTRGGNDPSFNNPQELDRLKRKLKDPSLSQKERSKLKRRLRELQRSQSKKAHESKKKMKKPKARIPKGGLRFGPPILLPPGFDCLLLPNGCKDLASYCLIEEVDTIVLSSAETFK